ncbi:MAG TPA: hypothetical protein VMF53_17385, partial [Alphaproteobacteria bacterium]|nr:hypothetical protein [Alphaproteobacteria bacterium]
SVDHFGRPTIRRQYAAIPEVDRGENSEPGENVLCYGNNALTAAIRELNGGQSNWALIFEAFA